MPARRRYPTSERRYADQSASHIDYRLNILGIRVWEHSCQLIARAAGGSWTSLGLQWELPIDIPHDKVTLKAAGSDTLRVTAWQYEQEHPGTDIREVMSQRKPFRVALTEHD